MFFPVKMVYRFWEKGYISIRNPQDGDKSISSFGEAEAGCPSIQDNKRRDDE